MQDSTLWSPPTIVGVICATIKWVSAFVNKHLPSAASMVPVPGNNGELSGQLSDSSGSSASLSWIGTGFSEDSYSVWTYKGVYTDARRRCVDQLIRKLQVRTYRMAGFRGQLVVCCKQWQTIPTV